MIKFDKLRMWIIHANIFLDFLILDKEFVRSVYKKNSQISSISSNKKIFFLILIFCLFVCFRLRRLKPNCKAGVIICGTRKQLLWLHCFSPFCVCVFYLRNIFFFVQKLIEIRWNFYASCSPLTYICLVTLNSHWKLHVETFKTFKKISSLGILSYLLLFIPRVFTSRSMCWLFSRAGDWQENSQSFRCLVSIDVSKKTND